MFPSFMTTLLLALILPAYALSSPPLFTTHDPLELTLVADLQAVQADRRHLGSRDPNVLRPEWRPALIGLGTPGAVTSWLPIKLRVRGHHRRQPQICEMPPLKLKLPTGSRKGPFADQRKLKLVTYCGGRKTEQDTLQEYLAYRIYGLLSGLAYQVRLVRLTYVDGFGGGFTDPLWFGCQIWTTRYGFLLENTKDMARRNQAESIKVDAIAKQFDQTDLIRFHLFQHMIGNGDFELEPAANLKRLQLADGRMIPVPCDLDMAWFQHSSITYQTEIANFCFPAEVVEPFRRRFLELRTEVFSLIQAVPDLNAFHRKRAKEHFEAFFAWLQVPKNLRSKDCAVRPGRER